MSSLFDEVKRIVEANKAYDRWNPDNLKEFMYSNPEKDPVLLCIGTDRVSGDSLGPFVGTLVGEMGSQIPTYGTLEDPVHAQNLVEIMDIIKEKHPNSMLICVDACLGRTDSVGKTTYKVGSFKPGAGVNKELPAVGDFTIEGIVNIGGFMPQLVIQNTRMNLVYTMAKKIARQISNDYITFMLRRRDLIEGKKY